MTALWPECTDPQKYVFEDVAIAAYILCLWYLASGTWCSFVFYTPLDTSFLANLKSREMFVHAICIAPLLTHPT